jgi:acetyl esterase/lipase
LYDQSVSFDRRLADLGVSKSFFVPKGAEHAFIVFGYGTENFDQAHSEIVRFLDERFKR